MGGDKKYLPKKEKNNLSHGKPEVLGGKSLYNLEKGKHALSMGNLDRFVTFGSTMLSFNQASSMNGSRYGSTISNYTLLEWDVLSVSSTINIYLAKK